MEYLSNDHEDHLNQHENSHKMCNEKEHPVVNFTENKWKQRQQHYQNYSMEQKPL